MNSFLDKYGTDTTTNIQLMRWAKEFYYCMRDEINNLKDKKDDKIAKQKIHLKQLIANINPGISEDKLTTLETKLIDNSAIQKEIVAIKQQLLNVVDKTQLQSLTH
ncbi:hypothetical protein LOTGIDRAFT_163246 [Lottia gigantea]|uniref:Uncharacterized protein n=1 Tax=Lottia gigantea TaxID=225164 RepID=V4BSH4_LOTGI|nr:hypothetical protein LOTGIDRAFT_163246 [Lottia gigantea]ESO91884.1 hypothetical protein LOTGIDRAFT_163246 [Lottia gigantea]